MIKHIIFDFDGTIADSSDVALQIVNELSEKYNYKKMTREELQTLNTQPLKDRFKVIGISFLKLPKMALEGMIRYRQLLSSLKTFEGIKEMLIEFKNQGIHLSIISSNSVENINDFLERYNLNYFDDVISANSIFGKHKTIKTYLKKYDLSSDEILYVGDELRDIDSCKKVSVKIIAVTWGYDSIKLLKDGGADYVCNKPEEIVYIVRDIKKAL